MDKKFKQMMDELRKVRRQLNESYMFDEEEVPYGDEEEMMMHERPEEDVEQGDSEEEKAMHAQEVIQHEPIIQKIREISIEGLKKYADHPTSSVYAFFKKVFNEADKVIIDGANGNK